MATARIIITDEVNCKILGLDLDTRKALNKACRFFQQNAKYQSAYRLGRWDGYISFFGIGGTTYLSFLDRILPILEQRGYYIEIDDQREPIHLEFEKISEDYWGDKCWPKGHRFEGEKIRLRDDQVEVINNFLANPQALQEVATGAGKTIMTATMSKICEKYGRSIVIVPNKDLVTQTEEDYMNVGLDVGVYYGDRKDLGKTHTICTWQSLNILNQKSKENPEEILSLAEFLDGVNAIIVDEVHQAKADVLKGLLTINLKNTPIRWGFTGTVPKDPLEFESIKCSLGEVVGKVTAKELQDKGVLSSCHVKIIQTKEFREFNTYQEELNYLVTDEDRLEWMSKMIKAIAETGNTLVLVDRIKTGNVLQQRLSNLFSVLKEDPDIKFISGSVKSKDRKEAYKEVATADNKITLATYGVAAVGINIPRIFNLVLIEPGKSFVRVIQSIGRGLRVAQDKDFVNIYDITAACKYSKAHLTKRKKYYQEAHYKYSIIKVDINDEIDVIVDNTPKNV